MSIFSTGPANLNFVAPHSDDVVMLERPEGGDFFTVDEGAEHRGQVANKDLLVGNEQLGMLFLNPPASQRQTRICRRTNHAT